MTEDKSTSSREFERIGRSVESVFEAGYANKKRVYTMSFWRGIFFGLGAALGGTLVVAVILYFLAQLTDIPFVGDIARTIRDSIETN